MNLKIIGILGIIAVATVSAFMADGDDKPVENVAEYTEDDYEWDDFDADEFWDEDNIEYITTESEPEIVEPEPETVPEQKVAPRAVAARMTCDDINKRIAELREDIKSYPDLKPELESLISRQRLQCAATVNRRPVRNYDNVNPVKVIDVPEPEPALVEEPAPVNEIVDVAVPEKTPEELAAEEEAKNAKIIENLSKGLCADGMQPNRYGCCAGESFKEVTPMVFACCPKDGNGQCLEPIK